MPFLKITFLGLFALFGLVRLYRLITTPVAPPKPAAAEPVTPPVTPSRKRPVPKPTIWQRDRARDLEVARQETLRRRGASTTEPGI